MIHVIAIITAKPGKRDELIAAMKANVPAVRAEQGCIEYGPAIDATRTPAKMGADTVVVIEKWADEAALAAHAASPHMAEYGAKTKDIVADRKIHIMQNA